MTTAAKFRCLIFLFIFLLLSELSLGYRRRDNDDDDNDDDVDSRRGSGRQSKYRRIHPPIEDDYDDADPKEKTPRFTYVRKHQRLEDESTARRLTHDLLTSSIQHRDLDKHPKFQSLVDWVVHGPSRDQSPYYGNQFNREAKFMEAKRSHFFKQQTEWERQRAQRRLQRESQMKKILKKNEAFSTDPFDVDFSSDHPFVKFVKVLHRGEKPKNVPFGFDGFTSDTDMGYSKSQRMKKKPTTRQPRAAPRRPALKPRVPTKPRLPTKASKGLSGLVSSLKNGIASVKNGISQGISSVKNGISSAVSSVKSGIASGLASVKSGLSSLFSKRRAQKQESEEESEDHSDEIQDRKYF